MAGKKYEPIVSEWWSQSLPPQKKNNQRQGFYFSVPFFLTSEPAFGGLFEA